LPLCGPVALTLYIKSKVSEDQSKNNALAASDRLVKRLNSLMQPAVERRFGVAGAKRPVIGGKERGAKCDAGLGRQARPGVSIAR